MRIDLYLNLGDPDSHDLRTHMNQLSGVGAVIQLVQFDPPVGKHTWFFDASKISHEAQCELAQIMLSNWDKAQP